MTELADAARTKITPMLVLARMFKTPRFRTMNPADLKIVKIKRRSHSQFDVILHEARIDPKAKIYEAFPIDHSKNITTRPTQVRYIEPRFMVHNSAINCSKGLNVPIAFRQERLVASCRMLNYTDPELNLWETVENASEDEIRKPTILFTEDHSYIQCLSNTIVVIENRSKYPNYVFRLPITDDISVGSLNHSVESRLMNVYEQLPSDVYISLHPHSELYDLNYQVELVKSLREAENKLEL